MNETLQFAPFSSVIDGGFWHKLSHLKLEVFHLDDSPKEIVASYGNGDLPGLPCRMSVDYASFDTDDVHSMHRQFRCHGVIQNFNTIEAFRMSDKKSLLKAQGEQLWNSIVKGEAIRKPSLLSQLCIITFADLKKYHYHYWFAFPALMPSTPVTMMQKPTPLFERFGEHQIQSLLTEYDQKCVKDNTGFFIIVEEENHVEVMSLEELSTMEPNKKFLLGFCDPCTLSKYPGWPLRNCLYLVAYHWWEKLDNGCVDVVCFRDRFKDGKRHVDHSIVLKIKLVQESHIKDCPNVVGWEKNEKQKLAPKVVNLSSSMDPVKLSESAVDLNLKLMRWRLLPELDLECISKSRCLLLGAGTLGCNVARCLLGWGVRHVTLIDNGKVSYSNPVRQSLFTFHDSKCGGKSKAEAAAQALKDIFPGAKANGINMSIPMIGHPFPKSMSDEVQRDVEKLDALISKHDVIFLLMDTRESRWLPTVIGAARRKLVLNAALGFDTYLIMRHGFNVSETENAQDPACLDLNVTGDQLGCYFCNDVVAPGNSLQDRTLDQQCTVSRPGLSMMTSALVVELFASILQHPLRGLAPAYAGCRDLEPSSEYEGLLGLVPHQIRGFLSRYQQMLPASRKFDKCTACASIVIDRYREAGFEFLKHAFDDVKYLEDLTGLTELHKQAVSDIVVDFDDFGSSEEADD